MSGAIEKLLDQNEAEATWALPGGKSLVDAARAELAALRADNEEMAQWVRDLQSGMYVNCVYCGHRYGPGETTPVSMADALKAHVEQCPKHPMSALRADNARKAKALEHAASYMVTARMDRPVYEKGDDSMLRGELEGHWQTEDWLIGLRELAEECAAIARESALSTPAPAGAEESCLGCKGGSVSHTCGREPDADRMQAQAAGAVVTLERLREWRGTIEQLLTVQNGCPLPSYEEAFRLANIEADKSLETLRKCIEGGAE